MSLEIVTDFRILLQLAKKLADGKKNNLPDIEIKKLEDEHNNYKELCLKSDKMSIGMRVGDL